MISELFGREQCAIAAPLFSQMEDTTILSCLQDYPSSHVWVDDVQEEMERRKKQREEEMADDYLNTFSKQPKAGDNDANAG